MIVDYHTHTALCKHGEGTVADCVRKGIAAGLDEIGCSEHIPMPDGFDLEHRMTTDEFEREYLPQVHEAREQAGSRITLRFGLEADFYAGTEEWVRKFTATYPFDYIIGSVHFLGEWGFDNPVFVHRYEERDIDQTYRDYFEAVKQSAASGLFDVIGHCDLVKKFGHRPRKDLTDAIREMMETIKRHDLCIEINTAGLRKPVHEIYPSEQVLSIASELQVPLTLGSDAHVPEHVAADFDAAIELLEHYGRGKLAVFEGRKRWMVPVSRLQRAG